MGLSRCIADLLNPAGAHAQGDMFLRMFMAMIRPQDTTLRNTKNCIVRLEMQIKNSRRLDIYIELDDMIIVIENKPWAGDQKSQLSDYAEHLKSTNKEKIWQLIYLCNSEPTEYSISKNEREALTTAGNFIELSFFRLADWLKMCTEKTKPLAVRIFIEEMEKFVRKKINGEVEMSEQLEIEKLVLTSQDNLLAAFEISKSMPAIKEKLLETLRIELQSQLKSEGMILDWYLNGYERYTGFRIKFQEEQKICLRFQFEYTGYRQFYWGIAKTDDSVKKDERWPQIKKLMDAGFHQAKTSDWYPWYSDEADVFLKSELIDWSISIEPWRLIQTGEFAKQVLEISRKVRKLFDEVSPKMQLT